MSWTSTDPLVDVSSISSAVAGRTLSRLVLRVCRNVARVGWVSLRTEPMSLGAWPPIGAVNRTFRSATTPPTGSQSLIGVLYEPPCVQRFGRYDQRRP